MGANGATNIQQLVQATINGTTVYVPAGSQYQTYVLNHPGNSGTLQASGASGGQAHQIVVHQGSSQAHHVLHPQQTPHHQQQQAQQQHAVYVQHAPSHGQTSAPTS